MRGEVYLRKSDFERLNRAREREGLPVFANPRNAASGGVRQLDPALTAAAPPLVFRLSACLGRRTCASQWEALRRLRALGFPVNPNIARAATLDDVLAYCRSGRSGATNSTTRSTASSSRSTISRCRSGWASSRAIRAGRSRLSSSRARRARSCVDIVVTRRPHRNAQSQRRARARADRRRHRQERDAAQRRLHREQRHSHRRHRAGDARRRRDSARRRPGARGAHRQGAPLPNAATAARSAAPTSIIRRARRCRAARTPPAPRRSTSACGTSRRAARWTSKGSATSWRSS